MERICGIGSCVPQGDDMANDTVKWRQIKFLVYPVFVVLGVYIILYLYCGEYLPTAHIIHIRSNVSHG